MASIAPTLKTTGEAEIVRVGAMLAIALLSRRGIIARLVAASSPVWSRHHRPFGRGIIARLVAASSPVWSQRHCPGKIPSRSHWLLSYIGRNLQRFISTGDEPTNPHNPER
jgi:hypothetical protein